jgi:hypothetical protein
MDTLLPMGQGRTMRHACAWAGGGIQRRHGTSGGVATVEALLQMVRQHTVGTAASGCKARRTCLRPISGTTTTLVSPHPADAFWPISGSSTTLVSPHPADAFWPISGSSTTLVSPHPADAFWP